jgi:osmotically-inducible protein OsmY
MKRMLLCFLIGVAAGALGYWYLQQEEGKRAIAEARETIASGTEKAKGVVSHGMDEIKEEMSRTGRVIRDKAKDLGRPTTNAVAAVPNASAAAIGSKLATDPSLSGQRIRVDVADGVATLAGTVATYEQIGRAMKVALESDGVHRVISLLQVSSSK